MDYWRGAEETRRPRDRFDGRPVDGFLLPVHLPTRKPAFARVDVIVSLAGSSERDAAVASTLVV